MVYSRRRMVRPGWNGVEELNSLVEELRDYFLENNINGTTDEVLMRYYSTFL